MTKTTVAGGDLLGVATPSGRPAGRRDPVGRRAGALRVGLARHGHPGSSERGDRRLAALVGVPQGAPASSALAAAGPGTGTAASRFPRQFPLACRVVCMGPDLFGTPTVGPAGARAVPGR